MKNFLLLTLLITHVASAQIFEMVKPYTGGHYAFSRFDPNGVNQFAVQFNNLWAADISSGFSQYSGKELGQTFTTSGMRFVWGKKAMQWTASTDYAFGFGKEKNEAKFSNGITQIMNLRATSNQINTTFGVALKENSVWLEGMYCTNIARVFIEYATVHRNGVESYGTEYKLNGLYKGLIRTMGIGAQVSYRKGKYILYSRMLMPVVIVGPGKNERVFTDDQSTQPQPNNFPSNYENYVADPATYSSGNQGLQSSDFKGFSFGFGFFYIIGKTKN